MAKKMPIDYLFIFIFSHCIVVLNHICVSESQSSVDLFLLLLSSWFTG